MVFSMVPSRGAFTRKYTTILDVTAVYVGTPHVLHHRNAKDVLLAGKHVLEKPACLEVEELEELIKIAKEKKILYGSCVDSIPTHRLRR